MDELINDFLVETKESIEILDNQLVTLEQDPNNKDLLGSIFRIMHTIKGTCGFLGLPKLESVAHAGENIMDKIRNNQIPASSANVSAIIEAIDKIKSIVAYLEENRKEPEEDLKPIIEKLNKAAAGEVISPKIEAQHTESVVQEKALTIDEGIKPEEEKNVTKVTEEVKKSDHNEQDKANNNSGQSTIRVNVDVLENLMQIVSELVLNRNQLLQLDRSVKDNKFTNPIQRLSAITSELQDSVMKTRMQPIKNAWTKFPRLIRDLGVELGKKIELVMIGEETELDRQLIETIKDPLTHMVRNSADHGLEMPQERLAQGKNEVGTVSLSAYHQGGHIIIEIADDGRGINTERIKKKILENSLASKEEVERMTDQQAMQYIFKAGFSTAEKITSVSGRGVGMDVVKTNIEKISGTVELNSVLNKGSRFILKIPLTLAIMPILIVESNKEKFGIPQINVVEMVRTGGNSVNEIEDISGKKILRLRDELLPLITLSEVLQINAKEIDKKRSNKKNSSFIVVCEVNGSNFGLIVDRIYDTEEIVLKPVTAVLKKIGMYSGNTILGDGQVIMIIDPAGLIKFVTDILDGRSDMSSATRSSEKYVKNEAYASFLILKNSKDMAQAVPLELVARLEEIDAKNIEFSNGKRVVQYRGGLMFLTELDQGLVYPAEGPLEVVVFLDKEKILGLVVKEIVDIASLALDSNKVLEDSDYHALVIQNKTMDVVDINEYFEKVFGDLGEDADLEGKGKHVLFVDDSPFFRKFIPPSIIEAGYKVTTAENGERALEILESGVKFDMIITDINMPKMSGKELSELCKKDLRFKSIPIVALTSSLEQIKQDQNQVNEGNIISFISKTNHEDLLEIISNILNNARV